MAEQFKKGFLSRQEVAAKYGVTHITVKNWESRGLPIDHKDSGKTGSNWYKEADVDQWYNDNEHQGEDASAADLRKKIAEATLSELKVLKATYQSIDIKTSVSLYERQCSNIRAKLIALASALSGRIPDLSNYQERYVIIDEEIAQILSELTIDKLTAKDWQRIIKDSDKND